MESFPQVLKNVRVSDKTAAQEDADVQKAVEEAVQELGSDGRILLRPSGTEPVMRVMAEARTTEICEMYVDRIISAMKKKGLVTE